MEIGALWAFLGWLTQFLGLPVLIRALILALWPYLATGFLHLDGFMDVTDAVKSCRDLARRLETLKDPNSGAFAVLFCGVYLLSCVAIWSEITKGEAVGVLGISFLYSRALSGFAVTRFRCAKNSGLAATFSDMADRKKAGGIQDTQQRNYSDCAWRH